MEVLDLVKESFLRKQQNLLVLLEQDTDARIQVSCRRFQRSLCSSSADWIKYSDPIGTNQRNYRSSQNA